MTIEDYEKAGELLLNIKRLEELTEHMGKMESLNYKSMQITLNNFSVIVPLELFESFKNSTSLLTRKLEKELQDL